MLSDVRGTPTRGFAPRIFCFEAAWCSVDDCSQIIINSWASPQMSLVHKLDLCRSKIWNTFRCHHRHLNQELAHLHDQMQTLSLSTQSQDVIQESNRLNDRIEHLLDQKYLYWRQCAKADWLSGIEILLTFKLKCKPDVDAILSILLWMILESCLRIIPLFKVLL